MTRQCIIFILSTILWSSLLHAAHDNKQVDSDIAPSQDVSNQAAQAPPEATPRRAPMSLDDDMPKDNTRKAESPPDEQPPAKRQKVDSDIKDIKHITSQVVRDWIHSQQKEWRERRCKTVNENQLQLMYDERRNMIINAVSTHNIDPNQLRVTACSTRHPKGYGDVLRDAILHDDVYFVRFLIDHNIRFHVFFTDITTKAMAELVLPYMLRKNKSFTVNYIKEVILHLCASETEPALIEFYLANGADITSKDGPKTVLLTLIRKHTIANDPQHQIYAKAALLVEAGAPLYAKIGKYDGCTWQEVIKQRIAESSDPEIKLAYERLEQIILNAIHAKENRMAVAESYLNNMINPTLPSVIIALAMAYVGQSK